MSARTTPRRWWILVILAVTQLVVVLDGTIINVALPQVQDHLGLTPLQSQWVIVAYALAFGALLLLGGRVADFWGRKRTYLVGMAGFAGASIIGGLAHSGTELVIARGFQGAFAALMAPAALALLTVTFPTGRDRNTAFAIYGAVAAAGAGVGMVLGGLLTQFADWRWCLLVNAPICLVALLAGVWLVTESKAEGDHHLDIPGTILIVAGLGSLVYGFTLAEHAWIAVDTIVFITLGALLVAAFVLVERRAPHPLLPLRIITHRVRAGAFLLQALAGTVTIGATVFLAFHLQLVLGFTPLVAGLATLPLPLAISVVAPLATKLLGKHGPRSLMIVGPLVSAAGLFLLTVITEDGSYFIQVLPGLLLIGIGLSLLFVPLQNVALAGVAARDAGAAGATVNATGQIGGSVGLSVFSAVAAAAERGASGASELGVLVSGYSAAFGATALALLLGAIIAFIFIRTGKHDPTVSAEPAAVAFH